MPQKEVAIINETTKEYLSRYLELEEMELPTYLRQ